VGQPTWVSSPGDCGHGLRLRYCCPSATHARARVVGFFSHTLVILNLCTTSRNGWITFRLPLDHAVVVNAFGHVSTFFPPFQQCVLYDDFRIALFLSFSHCYQPPFPMVTSGMTARLWVGQGRKLYLYCQYVFSFLFLFFLLTSSFAA